jgi:hypothetical protein
MSARLRQEAQASPATSRRVKDISIQHEENVMLEQHRSMPQQEHLEPYERTLMDPLPPPPPAPPQRGWLRAYVSVVVVALLVALIALTMRTFAPSRPGAIGPHQWSDVARLSAATSGGATGGATIYVAPSNPAVIYEILTPVKTATGTAVIGSATSSAGDSAAGSTTTSSSGSAGGVAYSLRRSDDSGAHWVSLPNPTLHGASWAQRLFTSPLDAHVVFLTLSGDPSTPGCPTPVTTVAPTDKLVGSVYTCTFQYVSRDGGQHWVQPTFPLPAQHFTGGLGATEPVQAQGQRLYATIEGDLTGAVTGAPVSGARLVVSDDGGTSWRLVDSSLQTQGVSVDSYRAPQGSTSLFATTLPKASASAAPPSLWRSDDAGAQWSRVGAMPQAQSQLLAAAMGSQGAVLYAAVLEGSAPPQSILVTADGGVSWQSAPRAGIPMGLQPTVFPAVGTLTDGSLVVGFSPLTPVAEATAVEQSANPPTPPSAPVSVSGSGSGAGGETSTGSQKGAGTPIPPSGPQKVDGLAVTYLGWRPGASAWFEVASKSTAGVVIEAWIDAPASPPQTLWVVAASPDGKTVTLRKSYLS